VADRRARERGSVLMLVPAAVLVLVILGSIAVDSSIAFLGQRALNNFTSEAANSAASAALDQAAFYTQGRIAIDPVRADDIVTALRRNIGSGLHDVNVTVTTQGAEVTVAAVGTVDDLFATVIPGVRHHWRVSAVSSATARQVNRP
jgi:hypothetical protein